MPIASLLHCVQLRSDNNSINEYDDDADDADGTPNETTRGHAYIIVV